MIKRFDNIKSEESISNEEDIYAKVIQMGDKFRQQVGMSVEKVRNKATIELDDMNQ